MSRKAKLEQMLRDSDSDPFLHFDLAMELLKEGRQDEALASFDRVTALDANYLAAYLQKGHALAAMCRADDARAALTTGIAAARRSGDLHAAEEMISVLQAFSGE